MRLLFLELRNYRNYARLELEPGVGLNLFLGANGQGKTNLLESVALLALIAYPFVWLLLLPFRVVGIAVHGVLALVAAVIMLPTRWV